MNPGLSRAQGNRSRSHGCPSLLLVLLLALHWGLPSHAAPPPGERLLLFIGSNTLGEHAAPGLARAYLLQKKQAKDVAIQRNGEIIYITGTLPDGKAVYIEVHATGSGDCFKSFLGTYTGTYDQCDIGMSSRRIKGEEVDEIEAKTGDVLSRRGDAPGLGCEHPVAMDGLAIITHKDNPLMRIAFTELKAIYSNQLKDWKELKEWKAAGLAITPVRRREPSGTLDVFVQNIKPDAAAMRGITSFVGNDEVAAHVATLPGGIGFIGQSYPLAPGVKRLQVYNDDPEASSMTAGQAVFPDVSAVQSGRYPFSRIVYFYTSSVHLSDEIKPFLQFTFSPEGQTILATEGGLVKIEGTSHQLPAARTTEEQRADVIAAVKSDNRQRKTILRLHGSNTVGAKCAVYLAYNYLLERQAKGRKISPIEDLTTELETPEGEKALAHDVMCDLDGDKVWETIEIRPTGSSDAFRSLLNGWCDIGMSSRRISPAEVRDLTETCGDLSHPGAQFALGLDAFAIIAHPENKVEQLTLDQTARLFLGNVPNWEKIGGMPGPIHVHSRPERSGTYRAFCDAMLQGRSIVGDASRHAENSAVAAAVAADPHGIGFVPAFATGQARVLRIGQDDATGFSLPTHDTVISARYPSNLCRYVYLYVPEEKPQALSLESLQNWETARDFALLSQTWRAQAIISSCGFFPEIAFEDKEGLLRQMESESITAYVQRLADLERKLKLGKASLQPALPASGDITARLLFEEGRDRLTPESQNTLQLKLASWLQLYPQRVPNGFLAEGWTDNLASDEESQAISTRRAQVVADLINSRLNRPVAVKGQGKSSYPPNNSEENKHLNRRVVLKAAKD
jgi:ABC-type phosphate transport system substrate-binding protein